MNEIVLGIIAAISTLLAGWFKYREVKLQEMHKQRQAELQATQQSRDGIISAMIERVAKLEARQDNLQDKIYEVNQKAVKDREELVKSHDIRIDQLRKEMRKLIDDSLQEIENWRDRYFRLMEEYQKLKLEHNELEAKFVAIETEVHELRALFHKRRKTDVQEGSNTPLA